MKIVYIIQSLGVGAGMERVLATKANYLSQIYGYEISILTLDTLPEHYFFEYSPKIHIESIQFDTKKFNKYISFFFPYFKNKVLRKKLELKINELMPDICISMFGAELPVLHKLNDGSKKIAEFHFSRNYLVQLVKSVPNLKYRWLRVSLMLWQQYQQRHQAKKYDCIVLLTEKDKLLWGNKLNSIVIPNPVSFISKEKSNLETPQILSIGRYIAQKGFDMLIESFSLIARQFPNWKLVIVGEGQDEKYLLQLIRNYKLELQVQLLPPTKNIASLLHQSAILAFPSRYEGFGLVLTEAMECGVPCIAFDCECGPSEIITHHVDGFLVEPFNKKSFAFHLQQLMDNHPLRMSMGHQAQINVKRFYTDTIMKKWTTLFNELKLKQ